MKKSLYTKVRIVLFLLLCVLFAALMFCLAITPNVKTTQTRAPLNCETVTNYTRQTVTDPTAPAGISDVYSFTLGNLARDKTLAFYISHHNIAVTVGNEKVFTSTVEGGAVNTGGGLWALVPLYPEDSGKSVSVKLSPVYSNYRDNSPDFVIGSESAIIASVFYNSLPETVLSLCIVLSGLFLLGIALYQTIKRNTVRRIYAIGALAIFAGIWRFTYGHFAYLVLARHSAMLYSLSVASLMFIALSMLHCVEFAEKRPAAKRLINGISVTYCAVYSVQLILQLAGISDLRYMLKITHATIIISAVVLCIDSVAAWLFGRRETTGAFGKNYPWLLGIGAMIDLLLYYFAHNSVGMPFTLAAILCFSLLEGVRLLIGYTAQKNALEEMQTKLTLSRTTTMMSQIRSHFVFNILNAISGMCKYDPERADDTVVRFARYLRNNIDIMEDDKNIPFSTDLRQLEDYVILEQVRFGDKLEFYTDIETENFMIPPLILQPVVENAIKHGISKKQTGGTVILRTRDIGESIVISVEDDGVGFDLNAPEKRDSVGLKNISFRLRHLVNGTLNIASEIGKGTVVTVTIPKKEERQ